VGILDMGLELCEGSAVPVKVDVVKVALEISGNTHKLYETNRKFRPSLTRPAQAEMNAATQSRP
jgi:hypothetical protein